MSLFKKKEKQTIVRDEHIGHSAIEDAKLISSVAPRANKSTTTSNFIPGIPGPVGVLGSAGIRPRAELFMGDSITPASLTDYLYRENESLARRTIGSNNIMPVSDSSYMTLTGTTTTGTTITYMDDMPLTRMTMPEYDINGHFVDPSAQEENIKVRAININQQGV